MHDLNQLSHSLTNPHNRI